MSAKQKPVAPEDATEATEVRPDPAAQAWHDERTREAIREADAGDFATPEELKATIRKYIPYG